MPKNSARRTNDERTQATRAALLAAARECFVRDGYGGTSTPAIVAAAGITRGALYHHFADKKDLFRHVVEHEAHAVAQAIETAMPGEEGPSPRKKSKREASRPEPASAREALAAGSIAYFEAMAVPGRTRLLLREGPAVLGEEAMKALDDSHAAATLKDGLAHLLGDHPDRVPLAELAALLSAAFDRAALDIEAGGDRAAYQQALLHIIDRLIR